MRRRRASAPLLVPAADLREVTLEAPGGGPPLLRFAAAYGFRNIQGLMRKVKLGRCEYDYVEVMACPSGAVQPVVHFWDTGSAVWGALQGLLHVCNLRQGGVLDGQVMEGRTLRSALFCLPCGSSRRRVPQRRRPAQACCGPDLGAAAGAAGNAVCGRWQRPWGGAAGCRPCSTAAVPRVGAGPAWVGSRPAAAAHAVP